MTVPVGAVTRDSEFGVVDASLILLAASVVHGRDRARALDTLRCKGRYRKMYRLVRLRRRERWRSHVSKGGVCILFFTPAVHSKHVLG